jgi:uncharacterized protein (TIGR00369 family)
MLQMQAHELNAFLDEISGGRRSYTVDTVDEQRLVARVPVTTRMLRPGGTVSGPTLMGLADGAAYCQILAHIGPVAMVVTSGLNIAFLRKPGPVDVLAEARFLRLGRRLAVVDVRLRSDGDEALVAQATVTYAIPKAG